MYKPGSTYRVQLHKDFTLAHLEDALPYIIRLGVKTLYASPVFAAAPGSVHGYDVINPHCINPEIGTGEDLRRISGKLRGAGVGWLQDIVPNHMAFHPGNRWLMDVLEKGQDSEYARFFDIIWDEEGKIMVPFLGGTLEEVISRGELKVIEEAGRRYFDYFGSRYPIADAAPDQQTLPTLQLANAQHYRLCHWQESDAKMSYRRFFTVNGLISLNMQDDAVFAHYHQYIAQLYREGVFTGLRIDHIDGLYNPEKYLSDLRDLIGMDAYIVVEKILEPGEGLPRRWPVQGTTGYDFLALVNNLFTQRESERGFTRFYEQATGDDADLTGQLHSKQAHILYTHMQGELSHLTSLLHDLIPAGARAGRDLKPVIAEVLIQLPVYRLYGARLPLPAEEANALRDLFRRIRKDKPSLRAGLKLIEDAFLKAPEHYDADYSRRALHAYQRLMQFSGPLMAKGVEDTLMYTYQRFIGHNDVGDSPESFGISGEDFHLAMQERRQWWPLTLNTTSTHDTKRGEDARAMLNVLTAIPEEWLREVADWKALNASLKKDSAPDAQDEYFIYQTIFATWPFDEQEVSGYGERLKEYLHKALREGKRNSNWTAPDEAYEQATVAFAEALLASENPFRERFSKFHAKWLDCGMISSLAQVLLRLTAPGIPDTYQGTELWDLSFVDPDNRRAVDYEARSACLDECAEWMTGDGTHPLQHLWEQRSKGGVKLWLIQSLLRLRGEEEDLFHNGQYVPLRPAGKYKQHIFAFARRMARRWIMVAVPLHLPALGENPAAIDWADTSIELPPQAPREWQSAWSNTKGVQNGSILLKDIFTPLPFAMLRLTQAENARAAGVLLSITSLPSSFGIGDLGPQARKMARALSRARQGFWQMLPLNPVSGGAGWSPYSSVSTMAGNMLVISPELLADDGLLSPDELKPYRKPARSPVDYAAAQEVKDALLRLAYQRYCEDRPFDLRKAVEAFESAERHWLDDFALYMVIKESQGDKPWWEWDIALRIRDRDALQRVSEEKKAALDEVRWQQAIFAHQWQRLRDYCAPLGIRLIGDLPFYASYDSADVWTHPGIFSVDIDGRMTGVAGVPPDYFSETGQLWSMPTYRWEVMQRDGYQWWVARLRKALQFYDVLRIDHFRALASYWEVPAGEETAMNGKWIGGPGMDFFEKVREALGGLPFIAEDLGDNMQAPYRLRDEAGLPGMKVLQFAFGENLPASVDAPHNYTPNCVAYSGTHDNNTSTGWWRNDAADADRARLSAYAGMNVTQKNVAEVMARLAYASVAQTAILPMQDVLRLDEKARMNMPSSGAGNWTWSMTEGAFGEADISWLRKLAGLYGRG